MRVVLFGAHGQLGVAIAAAARKRGLQVQALGHADCDVCDERAVEAAVRGAGSGDAVVNAAAKLGTGEAQTQPREQFETNVRGALLVALHAQRRGAAIVHFSTDYVFDGAKKSAYLESDAPNPLNMYGALKLASEVLVREANAEHYVLRIASVFGRAQSTTKGPNFVDRMLQAAARPDEIAVDDRIVMSPTYARDAADVALELVHRRAPAGIYHAANAGACTWLDFTNAIFELAGIERRAVPRKGNADPIPRPQNSALASERLADLGLTMRDWRAALAAYLAERGATRADERR